MNASFFSWLGKPSHLGKLAIVAGIVAVVIIAVARAGPPTIINNNTVILDPVVQLATLRMRPFRASLGL